MLKVIISGLFGYAFAVGIILCFIYSAKYKDTPKKHDDCIKDKKVEMEQLIALHRQKLFLYYAETDIGDYEISEEVSLELQRIEKRMIELA